MSARRYFVASQIASAPWYAACVGWTAHWNAYINFYLTCGGAVLWATLLAELRGARDGAAT